MSTTELVDSDAVANRGGRSSAQSSPSLWVWLAILVFAGLAVRLAAWKLWLPGTIESEGAEYARIAENLRSGVGFVGLVTPGAQLNFNPLFPFLIVCASYLTHNFELAARLVALVMGTLLPLPVFGVASRLFDRRTGFIAAILTALHPLLLNLSFTAFSEGPYITLFLCATYVVMVALDRASPRAWLPVGVAFGLAWLVRAEASAALAITLVFALLATEGGWALRCKRVAFAVAAFLLCALPVVVFIYRSTGLVRLEVKSQIFFYTGNRILAAERNPGVDFVSPGGHHEIPSPEPNEDSWQKWQDKWAFYGIASDGKGMGFPLRRHAEIIQEKSVRFRDKLILVAKGTRENLPVLLQRLASDWLGAPLLPALALLGAVRRPWRGPRAKAKWFVLAIGIAPVSATCFALWSEARYYFVLIPLLSIWAANGMVEVGRWVEASCAGWLHRGTRRIVRYAVPGVIGMAMTLSPLKAVRKLPLFTDSAVPTRIDREVGVWLGQQQNHPVKVIDLSIPLAFHAGAQFTYFPYCDNAMALQYLDAAHVDYVVLRRDEKFTKYYQDWVEHGISDQRAELVRAALQGSDKFIIYRWHWGEPAEHAISARPGQSKSHDPRKMS